MAINNSQIIGVKKTSESSYTWLPTPAKNGVAVTDEPIWASNTGRGSDGKMIGDIVSWKVTIEVGWPPLSFAEAKSIRDAIKGAGPFFDITYYDVRTDSMAEKTVYCGNIPRVLYSLAAGHMRYSGVAIKFVEQ